MLLFARSDLYAERSRRPGLTRIVASLFQVTVVALVFSVASGHTFSSYYIFYGSLALAIVTISLLRWGHTLVTGWLLASAGYPRRTLLVGSGRHLDQVAHALADSPHGGIEPVGYVSLTPRPDNGLRSLGELAELPEILAEHRVQEVIIADPDFPQAQAVELVDVCHRRGVEVHVAPSTMEILDRSAPNSCPASRCRCSRSAAGVRGRRLRDQADVRRDRRDAAAARALAAADGDRARGQADLARAGALPLGAAGHGRRAVRLPQVPHDARGRRARAGGARGAQRDSTARCSRSATTRA